MVPARSAHALDRRALALSARRAAPQAARARGMPLRVLAVGAAQPVAGADAHLADAEGRARHRYGVGSDGAAYLLRPDQHVCARWLQLRADRLQAALSTALPA